MQFPASTSLLFTFTTMTYACFSYVEYQDGSRWEICLTGANPMATLRQLDALAMKLHPRDRPLRAAGCSYLENSPDLVPRITAAVATYQQAQRGLQPEETIAVTPEEMQTLQRMRANPRPATEEARQAFREYKKNVKT